ncbi:2-oxo-3-deoxygalactonate 6-phosphate aldolase [Escherichia coli]|nr:2-oxo-3-deoxygalactonate 6-phosphate aldolase [Escherichia coli]
MQWQTKLPLIAILRGIKPDESLPLVGSVIDRGIDRVEMPVHDTEWARCSPPTAGTEPDTGVVWGRQGG